MNLLFVLEYYPPHIGGVETVFEKLCEGLVERGHSVSVITSRLKNVTAFEIVNGVKVYRVGVPNRYLFTFLAIPQAFKLAGKASLVHTTTYNGAFPAWLASRLHRKKCVITVHEVLGSSWKDLTGISWFSARLHQLLEKLVIRLPFDRYVSVSGSTCDMLKMAGVDKSKLEVIYNGIDAGLFNPLNAEGKRIRKGLGLEGKFLYLYYGRPGISKGVEFLVQAVPHISEKVPDSKLLLILAHDPEDRYRYIKGMVKETGIEDRVLILDPVPKRELPDYIAAADCVVVPSLSEGFGFTAAEACAMQKPVVASDVASLPEVVSGRYVLVQPRNPLAIAEGISRVYHGEIKNSDSKIFSWESCVQGYLKVYEGVLGKDKLVDKSQNTI